MAIETTFDLLPTERAVAAASKDLSARISDVLRAASGPTLANCLESESFHDAIVAHIHAFMWAKHSKTFNAEDFFTEEVIAFACDSSTMATVKAELALVMEDHFGLTLHHFSRCGDAIDIYTFPLRSETVQS